MDPSCLYRRSVIWRAGTANVFVYYPYLKKARSTPAHYVHGSVAPMRGPAEVKLRVIVVVERWITGLFQPAFSRPTRMADSEH
jgi:hypothetical protein